MSAMRGSSISHAGPVSLARTNVTGAGLCSIRRLPILELDLTSSRLDNSGMTCCRDLDLLESLNVSHTAIGDSGLACCKDLKHLQMLDCSHTAVTDIGLMYLTGLAKLQSLNLNGTCITKAGIRKLQEALPNVSISDE